MSNGATQSSILARFLADGFRRASLRNVAFNMMGGVWTGVLVLLCTPLFVSRLGLDGYGVIGIWLMLQAVMALLDLGVGATVVREMARDGATEQDALRKRELLRTLEVVVWGLAICIGMTLASSARWIACGWLGRSCGSGSELVEALFLMGCALGLQFPYVLYTNALTGLQKHGVMNAVHVTGASVRYGVGSLVLIYEPSLDAFFATQVVVAGAQTLFARWVVWRELAHVGSSVARARISVLRDVWRFSAGMSANTAVAIVLANLDRIILSRAANIDELGRYALAFTAAGVLQLGIQPFYRTFFPRYAQLVSSGGGVALREEYLSSCGLLAAIIVPIAAVAAVFAPLLMYAWLGEADATVVSCFRWLMFGIACSGLGWLPAAFQQAHGWTTLHVGMMAGAVVLGAPIVLLMLDAYGAQAATAVWVLHGVAGLTVELWLMHRRLLPGDLMLWYRRVLVRPALVAAVTTAASWAALSVVGLTSRVELALWVAATMALTLGAAVLVQLTPMRAGSEANLLEGQDASRR